MFDFRSLAISLSRSMKTHRAAPREMASRPMDPVPPKTSMTVWPSVWPRRREKMASRTKSGMGRVFSSPSGL